MSRRGVNLARVPFVNARPLRRLVILLWALATLLFIVNVALYWNYRSGSVEARSRLQELRAAIRLEEEAMDDLWRTLTSLDLDTQNEQVVFLNEKISERTFPWSRLFERLEEVLPRQVRLLSLAPQLVRQKPARRSRSRRLEALPALAQEERVELRITGAAAGGEALLELIDALFEHPLFDEPRLWNDREGDTGVVRFELNVSHFPYRDVESDAGEGEGSDSEESEAMAAMEGMGAMAPMAPMEEEAGEEPDAPPATEAASAVPEGPE